MRLVHALDRSDIVLFIDRVRLDDRELDTDRHALRLRDRLQLGRPSPADHYVQIGFGDHVAPKTHERSEDHRPGQSVHGLEAEFLVDREVCLDPQLAGISRRLDSQGFQCRAVGANLLSGGEVSADHVERSAQHRFNGAAASLDVQLVAVTHEHVALAANVSRQAYRRRVAHAPRSIARTDAIANLLSVSA